MSFLHSLFGKKHLELTAQKHEDRGVISPGIEAEFFRALQLEDQIQRDPRAIATLIEVYRQILARLQPDENPSMYVWTQLGLGKAYRALPTGNPTANLERAIACYQEALPIAALETDDSLDYARIQNNLGNAYRDLPTQDRIANLTRAIVCFQEASRIMTPETAPLDYARIQNNLGNVYGDLPTQDHAASLKQAIACYKEALRFRTPETDPLGYANTQHNLGNVYRDLPTQDHAASLKQAITCYKEALRFRTPETDPLGYALTQNCLGIAYRSLPTGDCTTNLTQAVACFQEALRFRTPEKAPLDYANTQNCLGNAYRNLLTDNPTANLERAIACYKEALRVWTPETDPLGYARVQGDLGTAYRDLPTANLEQAVACCQEALCFLTPETSPLDYAHVQSTLGTIYTIVPMGDPTANLKQAIACFQEALRFLTPEMAPQDYAATQNNLGNAYKALPTRRDRAANLGRAISCYQEALRVWTPETGTPLNYAVIEHNLGTIYSQLPTGDRAANLEHAIACYQEALRFRTPKTDPLGYANTQNCLGIAYSIYSELSTGDITANLERAITCYQEALCFLTLETDPHDYAATQSNLGAAYSYLPTGDPTVNLERAIACYQEALRVWTPEMAPLDCRKTNRNLADLYFTQRKWKIALSTYYMAMAAGERLYRAGLSAESKATEMAENAVLYRNAAFSAACCGEDITEALRILEQGKTRLLTEALRLRIHQPVNVPDDIWMAYTDASDAVRTIQAGGTMLPHQRPDSVQTYAAYAQAAHAATTALDNAITQVRVHAPDFLREIDLHTAQSLLLNDRTSLVAFCITEQGSMGFVMDHHEQGVRVVKVPAFTQTDLRRLFFEWDTNSRPIGGWLVAYDRYQREHTPAALTMWQEAITHTLVELGQRLLTPILSTLPPSVERIILLPSAALFLFPLHAAPLSEDGSELVCDRYQVSYAPSIEVLADARAKAVQRAAPELYAVINPTADLIFAPIEGAAIAELFVQPRVDKGRTATKQRVIDGVRGRTYVHFACHGSYTWNDPPESGLRLADSYLTLAELQREGVDLSSARLATLSACETGITDVVQGSAEEYVGLPAGFMLAGVPCVVSSLWAVRDLSTALLMKRFYRNHLQDGMDIAEALRKAQAWIRQATAQEMALADIWEQIYQASGENNADAFRWIRYYRARPEERPFEHPYYWAAFTCAGA